MSLISMPTTDIPSVNDFTTMASSNMAHVSSTARPFLIALYSKVWTKMTSSEIKAPTAVFDSPTRNSFSTAANDVTTMTPSDLVDPTRAVPTSETKLWYSRVWTTLASSTTDALPTSSETSARTSVTSAVDDLTTLASNNMADTTNGLPTLLTTLHSNLLTNMTSIKASEEASTAISRATARDISDVTSVPSSTLSPSMSSSSLTSLLVTHATALINSTIPNTISDEVASNDSTISSYLLEEQRRCYLDLLQEDTTRKLIPTMIFLAIVAIVGLLGNSMVLLVYSRKPRRNATDIFIMAIAVFDLCTNVLAIPGEIYDMFHFWDFDLPALCKFRVFFNAFTILTSAMVLLAVAFSRYKKVCRPFGKQTSLRTAKITTIVMAVIIFIFSTPQLILNGIQTRPTPRKDVLGKECSTEDDYLHTIWPLLYTGFFMLLFLSVCIPLIVFYVLIGVKAWRHSSIHGVPIIHKTPTTSDHTMSDTQDSADDAQPTSTAWSFFRKKKKYDIAPGESSKKEGNGIEEKNEINALATSDSKDELEERSAKDADTYCTKMMRSPTKDKSHVNIPMLRELSFKLTKIRDSEINTDQSKDSDKETEKQNPEASNVMSPLVECPTDHEKSQKSTDDTGNCQNENATLDRMSDFAASMQWVDITYCLNEQAKAEEKDDVTRDSTLRKKSSQSARVSRQSSLKIRQKWTDTLTRARKAKKESMALSEIDKPTKSSETIDADGDCANNHITFHETVTETNGDIKKSRELKSCDSSPRNSPRNGTLKSKSVKSRSHPHRRVLTRTTLMLIIISAVYIIVFVPYLVLMSCKFTITNFLENMSDAGYVTYNIFMRFFFVNSAANAVIYSLCDVRFRDQVLKILRCKK